MSKTFINVILDESGSMYETRRDTVGGFNTWLKDRKTEESEDPTISQILTLTKFNTLPTTIYSAQPIMEVPSLDDGSYRPGGNTALFDAVANSIRLTDPLVGVDDRVLVLIITDGEENSSRETSRKQITEIIKERESRGNYTFVYLGAKIEDWAKDLIRAASTRTTMDSSDPNAIKSSWRGLSDSNRVYNRVGKSNTRAVSTKSFYTDKDD